MMVLRFTFTGQNNGNIKATQLLAGGPQLRNGKSNPESCIRRNIK